MSDYLIKSKRFRREAHLASEMNREAEHGNPLITYPINPRMTYSSIAEACLGSMNQFLSSFGGIKCIRSNLRGLQYMLLNSGLSIWPIQIIIFYAACPKVENLLLELTENHLRQ